MKRQFLEGLKMDMWHLHALAAECVLVPYINKADDFIRDIDLEGVCIEGEDLNQGMKEKREGK